MAAIALSPPGEANAGPEIKNEPETKPALTPPTSEGTNKKDDDSDSELSDLEPEEISEDPEPKVKPEPKQEDDGGEIFPDHFYEGGNIPVFKPTMNQFRSFKEFISKIDKYGMKSGIVKVIPPQEWRDKLPALDEQVKSIRVKNPITQEFHGSHGTYTQANMEKQRTYNLPQWKSLCEESNHQPPAKRGERRRNQERPTRTSAPRTRIPPVSTSPAPTSPAPQQKRKVGRPSRIKGKSKPSDRKKAQEEGHTAQEDNAQVPPTPTSPAPKLQKSKRENQSEDEAAKLKGRQPKSVSSRRKHNKESQADVIDEEAFKKFDYRVYNQDEWSGERVQELETAYWKSLTFNNPMYGADMPGSLFDDTLEDWNVAKLENLLDVLGQKVPGVNTTYLYLGMWKATFAWHLEDVDLYSINYIHFGAPKQWYSISQADARRFERAMQEVWPSDAKNCDQFLRHKTYLISPQLLQSQYNIRVNRLVHYEGEFVITFPYGYHSGYNLGYNCAESVNFATESWLEYGRIARKCNCEADSVWVDVRDIERKLRGEPTPEYYEETEEEDEDDEEEAHADLPTPPGSVKGKTKRSQKRKRDPNEKDSKPKIKKLRIKLKAPSHEPCVLCPNDPKYDKLLPTDNGKMAHRLCGMYTPETYISNESGFEQVCNVANIDKARLELKCQHCRNKKGSAFQCSAKKCTRAYHATCAAQAGVLVDVGLVPVFGEDGTEYIDTGIDFRCKVHRSKRGKNMDSAALEEEPYIRKQALKTFSGDIVQAQFFQQEIFAGIVLANRKDEEMLLVETLPKGEQMEIEYKWLLILDPMNSQRPIPSENAKPMPVEMARTTKTTAEAPRHADHPKTDDPFCDGSATHKWSEFATCKPFKNSAQVNIDFGKADQLWHYLGKTSTEAKAQYTHNPSVTINNVKGNFLESVRIASAPVHPPAPRKSYPASYPSGINQNAINAARANSSNPKPKASAAKERPYAGKYAITDPIPYQYKPTNKFNPDGFQPRSVYETSPFRFLQYSQYGNYSAPSFNQNSPPVPNPSTRPTSSSGPSHDQFPEIDSSASRYYNYSRTPLEFQNITPGSAMQSAHSQGSSPQGTPSIADMTGQKSSMRPNAAGLKISTQVDTADSVLNDSKQQQGVGQIDLGHSSKPNFSNDSSAVVNTPDPFETKGVSHLNVPEKYFFLHEAERNRPPVYQSPYAAQGGFTTPWLPVPEPTPKLRPRGPSMSEDYLAKQKPSQQEEVARNMKVEKARLRQENHERVQRRLSQSQSRPSTASYFPPHPPYGHIPQPPEPQKPQHLPLSVIQDPHSHKSIGSQHSNGNYYDSGVHFDTSPTYNPYSPSYLKTNNQYNPPSQASYVTPDQHALSQTSTPSTYYPQHAHAHPYSPSIKPEGLQFSSPQDFRMQMENASQHGSSHDQGFQRFYNGLQTAAAGTNSNDITGVGPGGVTSESGGGAPVGPGQDVSPGGNSGSPLKYEMSGAGGETLPMMRENSRFSWQEGDK